MDFFPVLKNYLQQQNQQQLAEDDEIGGIGEMETNNVTNDVRDNDIPLDVSPDEVYSLVAKQMTSLSMEDREKVYYDLHGVSEEVKETPEMVASSLLQLELELQKLQLQQKYAYEAAKSMNPSYVQNPEFQLKFLRADLFDAPKAAFRLARHFQNKLELFGRDKLARDIQQDDLDKETIDALYSGYAQTLPLRDRAGRLVHIWFHHPANHAITAKVSSWMLDVVVNKVFVELRCISRHFSCSSEEFFMRPWCKPRMRKHNAKDLLLCCIQFNRHHPRA
jgi:hypothetical protein